jgi:hypothetical protein
MRNFWNKFWISFWNEIKEQRFIGTVIEFIITIVIFTVINAVVFDGKDISYATMIAGCALCLAINTRRQLYKQ